MKRCGICGREPGQREIDKCAECKRLHHLDLNTWRVTGAPQAEGMSTTLPDVRFFAVFVLIGLALLALVPFVR